MPFNLIRLIGMLFYYSTKIKPGSLVLAQYPLLGINKFAGLFLRSLRKKKCKVACIIHDIDSIRSLDNAEKIKNEIRILSNYEAVIAHNGSMADWLKSNGYTGQIVVIALFDYLVQKGSVPTNNFNSADVVFAGNLGRCGFLKDLKKLEEISFGIYGPGLITEAIKDADNVKWKGVFTPEEIVNVLEGRFGLIWDGTSFETCTGVMGEYLKYNTPHKVSLYLTCGIPVIVPATAAIAGYIKSNNLGITVNSLTELKDKLAILTEPAYQEMRANAIRFRSLLIRGDFLSKAVNRLEKILQDI